MPRLLMRRRALPQVRAVIRCFQAAWFVRAMPDARPVFAMRWRRDWLTMTP
ncbi:MAG: hypothetical protein HYU41_27740 [Candidatus Rokubacteria bacterium]|nr:hypothetical protein [Candidatus Rokubacteria bacterium]